jgi:putative transposase
VRKFYLREAEAELQHSRGTSNELMDMIKEKFVEYNHTPPHLFRPDAIYFVTGTIYKKTPLMNTEIKLSKFTEILFEQASKLKWGLEAWSVLPNHYHFVARSPKESSSLKSFIQAVHSISAKFINRIDNFPGRRVWYNYWDSCITNETSYLARLHYVHMNPVKHGYVDNPEDYPFCSYSWFMISGDLDFQKRVFAQPIDRINVMDVE